MKEQKIWICECMDIRCEDSNKNNFRQCRSSKPKPFFAIPAKQRRMERAVLRDAVRLRKKWMAGQERGLGCTTLIYELLEATRKYMKGMKK